MSEKSSPSESATEIQPPKAIAVFGLGSIGKRHVRNLISLGCQVRGYDPSSSVPEDRNAIATWADAAVIASPSSQHFEDILLCTVYKLPVFVEKPVVTTKTPLGIDASNIKMVGYNLRFHSCTLVTEKWLRNNYIGRPLWARFTCAQYNDRKSYYRDGVILNWSHEIDLARHLLGELQLTAADATHEEDIADLTFFACKSASQITVHLDYVTRPERRGFLIVGEHGSIEADLVRRQAFLKDQSGRIKTVFHGTDSFDLNYFQEMEAFLARLDGKETIGCSAEDGLSVARLCIEAKEMIYGE